MIRFFENTTTAAEEILATFRNVNIELNRAISDDALTDDEVRVANAIQPLGWFLRSYVDRFDRFVRNADEFGSVSDFMRAKAIANNLRHVGTDSRRALNYVAEIVRAFTASVLDGDSMESLFALPLPDRDGEGEADFLVFALSFAFDASVDELVNVAEHETGNFDGEQAAKLARDLRETLSRVEHMAAK